MKSLRLVFLFIILGSFLHAKEPSVILPSDWNHAPVIVRDTPAFQALVAHDKALQAQLAQEQATEQKLQNDADAALQAKEAYIKALQEQNAKLIAQQNKPSLLSFLFHWHHLGWILIGIGVLIAAFYILPIIFPLLVPIFAVIGAVIGRVLKGLVELVAKALPVLIAAAKRAGAAIQKFLARIRPKPILPPKTPPPAPPPQPPPPPPAP